MDLKNVSELVTVFMAITFVINIVVQLTKGFIPLPTKLWTITVSLVIVTIAFVAGTSYGLVAFSVGNAALVLPVSFVAAYVAMYGFDTTKELWNRFKNGDDINEQK